MDRKKFLSIFFPNRLDVGSLEKLVQDYSANEKVANFWNNLQSIYLDFKATKKLRAVKVNEIGEYKM